MKKTLITSSIFILFGAILGINVYTKYKDGIISTFSNSNDYFFIQEGVYSSKELMQENTKNIKNKIIETNNGKYYVYLAITTDIEIANKIKNIYEKEGYQIFLKEVSLSNEEFFNNIIQFDMLIKNATTEKEILTIESVVLANYEEILKKEK